MSILDELSSLVANAEQVKAREDQMLGMFELAGYDLNSEPTMEQEEDNIPGDPKDLIELLKEALGNPPTEPGQWIRIQDIPRYIEENLVVPEDLDAFNMQMPQNKPNVSEPVEDVPAVAGVPRGYNRVGTEQYMTGKECPDKQDYYDTTGQVWHKITDERWTMQGDDDLGGYRNVDADNFAPLIPIASVRNRSRVL
jgi:hypothetical protein